MINGDGTDIGSHLRRCGVGRGDPVGLAVDTASPPGDLRAGIAFGQPGAEQAVAVRAPAAQVVRDLDAAIQPRWVVWSGASAAPLVAAGTRLATSWDLAAVHRLLVGGWRADPGRVWAHAHGLPADGLPGATGHDLFSMEEDLDQPVRDDGHLRPDWWAADWSWTPERLCTWALLALRVARRQRVLVDEAGGARMLSTARSESTAELLCAELSHDGLPMDRREAESIIGELVGERPETEAEAVAQRHRRDRAVLDLAPADIDVDLRNPAQIRSLLRRVGVEAPDTRAWRLESLRDAHPVVEALLTWRKAERIATTFGYAWLDEHLGPDGRLRGAWTASDGAAGRMTASAGLHNMPALLRGAVIAEAGHRFVRADLGQIEPRVLAAVSGDPLLTAATESDDLYAPIARSLHVDRPTAKVAVLGAMYGQTTGRGAQVLRRLEQAYPVAMRYLADADAAAQAGRTLRTAGGRAIPTSVLDEEATDERSRRARAAARGRYGRNAVVQGAAAELFKVWALTARMRGAQLGARVVLCLHDELLVHVPAGSADEAAARVGDWLHEAAHRWMPGCGVRFVADVSVIERWSDAKA